MLSFQRALCATRAAVPHRQLFDFLLAASRHHPCLGSHHDAAHCSGPGRRRCGWPTRAASSSFYPYLKASFLTPAKQALGQTMEFKTTLKGANATAFSLRTFGPALLIVAINAVTLGFGLATLDASINAAQV